MWGGSSCLVGYPPKVLKTKISHTSPSNCGHDDDFFNVFPWTFSSTGGRCDWLHLEGK